MKKTFTLIIASMLSLGMYAFPNQSILSVSASNANGFYVTVDGARYRASDNVVLINNLSNGYHQVQVYQQRRGGRGNPFNNFQMIFNGRVYVKPMYHLDISINRFGKAFIDEQLMANAAYENDNYGGSNQSDNQSDNHNYNNQHWDNDGDNHWGNSSNNASGRIMNNVSFEQFKQTLKNEDFENARLSLAKQVIENNLFSTAQVRELMRQFNFENNQLELAKYAYQFTTDKGNYFTLANEFSFSSNKESLMRHIQNNR
jgi:Domain of unknown function (DUF4476)